VFFCGQAKRAGFAILIDPILSRQVKHCGEIEFGMEHAEFTRQHRLAEESAHGTH
jgi:hypothetical protein